MHHSLKFTRTGNGTDVNYAHNRNRGITVNSLDVSTGFGVDKLLCTGGRFLGVVRQ